MTTRQPAITKQVKLTWPDGQVTITDAKTIDRYEALYGERPKVPKIEEAAQ